MDMNIIILPIMFILMYFFMIKPQQKRAKEVQDMLSKIEKGSRVVTIGGLHGIVEELTDTTVVLDCEGVYLTFERRAIATVKQISSQELQPQQAENVNEESDTDSQEV